MYGDDDGDGDDDDGGGDDGGGDDGGGDDDDGDDDDDDDLPRVTSTRTHGGKEEEREKPHTAIRPSTWPSLASVTISTTDTGECRSRLTDSGHGEEATLPPRRVLTLFGGAEPHSARVSGVTASC